MVLRMELLSTMMALTFVLHAPFKKNVFLIGDFNDWKVDNDYLLNKSGGSEVKNGGKHSKA